MIELNSGALNPTDSNQGDTEPNAGQPPSESNCPNHRSLRLSWGIVIFSLIALAITSYLVSVALTSSKVAGCGGGQIFDCNDVVNSRWSRLLGIPVSLLALGLYLSVLVATFVGSHSGMSHRNRGYAWHVVVFGGLSAGMAAIWFTSLQFFVVKHLCSYCLAAHSCGLIIAGLLIWYRPLKVKKMCKIAMLSLLGIGMLIGGQLAFKPATHEIIEFEAPKSDAAGEIFEFTPPGETADPVDDKQSSQKHLALPIAMLHPSGIVGAMVWPQEKAKVQEKKPERRLISVQGGAFQLDVTQWPLDGKPTAKYVFIEMFDYTCDHCRRTHSAIAGAKQKLGDNLAVITLPVPLNTKCNSAITTTGPRMVEACEIAQLAVAVWRVAPDKFPAFHHYLMTTPTTPTFGESKAKAITMLGTEKTGDQPSLAEKLETEMSGKAPGQYIAQHVQLYQRVGAGTVPKLMFPGTSIIGEFTSADALVKIIEQQCK